MSVNGCSQGEGSNIEGTSGDGAEDVCRCNRVTIAIEEGVGTNVGDGEKLLAEHNTKVLGFGQGCADGTGCKCQEKCCLLTEIKGC